MARIAKRLALVCVALLTVGAGVAYATGTLDPFVAADGTISACVQKASGDVRIVEPGTSCNAHGEVALSWNTQAPGGAAFVGSAGSLPNGAPGTVQETVDPTGRRSRSTRTRRPTATRRPGSCRSRANRGGATSTATAVLLMCDPGWIDQNGLAVDGCERQVA